MALDASREDLTTAGPAKEYDIRPAMISDWKRVVIENMAAAIGGASSPEPQISDTEVERLHAKIGQLVIGRNFFRQPPFPFPALVAKAVKQGHPGVRRHCGLLSLARSGLYDRPRGESAGNPGLMAIIDWKLPKTP